MPVARINEIIRKFLSSIFSLISIMIFISYIPISIHNLIHNSEYTNFNETKNKTINISTDEDYVEKKVLTNSLFPKVWVYGIYFVICCLLLQYFCCRERTRNYLNNLYNWLFCRNQNNEPAVHYRDNGITWIG